MKDRIKFFSKYDMSIGFYLKCLKKKLDEFDDTIEYNNINDILELKKHTIHYILYYKSIVHIMMM